MKNIRVFIGIAAIVLGFFLTNCDAAAPDPTVPTPTAESAPAGETGRVVNVIDGDTIDVLIDRQEYRVRYIGVNTPERDEACYDEATDANANWVSGQTVTLVSDVSDTDRYGRLLRYIYVDGTFLNAWLVRNGWAEAVYYPPDISNADWFNDLENDARQAGLGCHPSGVFE